MMKIILSAKKDEFWSEIVNELTNNKIDIAYWIGEIADNKPPPKNCFYHEIVDSYELNNLLDVAPMMFNIERLTLEEYYSYLKILDRADDLGGFSFNMRDRLLKDQLNYWCSVISAIEPTAIIFSNIPHLLSDYPLYLVAKSLGIETMIFNVTPFSGWHYLTNSILPKDGNSNLIKISDDISSIKAEFITQSVIPYENKNYSSPDYMKKQFAFDKRSKSLLTLKRIVKFGMIKSGLFKKRFTLREDWRYNFSKFVGQSGLTDQTRHAMIKHKFHKELKVAYLKTVSSPDTIIKAEKYIYVPLHYQPEATTAPCGGFYADQIYMIEQLRLRLPDDITIIVKEHYSQFTNTLYGFRGRELSYWNKLSQIKNLYLAPMSYDQRKLILNSLCVATVTGTAGWEAIQYGKYSIVFGNAWYSTHPNAIKFENLTTVILNKILAREEPLDTTDQFLDTFCKSLIKSDLHNYSSGKVERSTTQVFNVITSYLNIKRVENANQ